MLCHSNSLSIRDDRRFPARPTGAYREYVNEVRSVGPRTIGYSGDKTLPHSTRVFRMTQPPPLFDLDGTLLNGTALHLPHSGFSIAWRDVQHGPETRTWAAIRASVRES